MAPKQEWLIIMPDVPGMLEKRMEVRPAHLEALKPHVENGTIVLGGATLDEPMQEGQGMKSNGSAMILCLDTKEDAIAFLEKDTYTKSGVWDLSKAQVIPFKSAVRQAL